MGVSDTVLIPFYKRNIRPDGSVALLGFTNNNVWSGDLYDMKLNNWNINEDWELDKQYDTIICTRCAYFSRHPLKFIERCHSFLSSGGMLYVDWGLGDHWRFKDFKVGWVKNNEHEYAYEDDNYLWSMVWDDSFLDNNECIKFCDEIKNHGYKNLKNAIYSEVPEVLKLSDIAKYFDVSYTMKFVGDGLPLQLYVLLTGIKK